MQPQHFQPRPSRPAQPSHDEDGIKLYAISLQPGEFDCQAFLDQLRVMKRRKSHDWGKLASFAIFHRGQSMDYLVLVYWGNDNELFVDVDVKQAAQWQRARQDYSFCLWDMEVMWFERNCFVQTLYTQEPDLAAYRRLFFDNLDTQ